MSQDTATLPEVLPETVPPVSESRRHRRLFTGLALIVAIAYAFFLASFWAAAPSRPGIDENAYLLGGRNLLTHHTTGFKPADDYQFVGAMWVRNDKTGWYYPKYPAGTSLLYAIAMGYTRFSPRPVGAYLVSPSCTVLAILGMFFLARSIIGSSFLALLAMIVLGCLPTTLQLSQWPNSHAPSLGFAVWGMFFLVRWCSTGSIWRGILAGLLLGYTFTIRYSEGLLLLPIGIAALSRIQWRKPTSYLRAAVPVVAWLLPVALLLLFNWNSMGRLTGYDSTGESLGFTWKEFFRKWDFALAQLHHFGLFFIAPLGLAGMLVIFRRSVVTGLLLLSWFLPGTLLYIAYYWGTNMPGIGYLRFFTALFPPLIVAAFWLIHRAGSFGVATALAAGVVTLASSSVGLWTSLADLERQHRGNLNLQYSADAVLDVLRTRHVKVRPMLIADDGMFPMLLQHLQMVVDADCYEADTFERSAGGGFGIFGMMQTNRGKKTDQADRPVLLQQARIDYMEQLFKGKTEDQLKQIQQDLIGSVLRTNGQVFAVLTTSQAQNFTSRYITGRFTMTPVAHWSEPCAIRSGDDDDTVNRGRSSPLAPHPWDGQPIIRWQPQVLTMYEITRGDK